MLPVEEDKISWKTLFCMLEYYPQESLKLENKPDIESHSSATLKISTTWRYICPTYFFISLVIWCCAIKTVALFLISIAGESLW